MARSRAISPPRSHRQRSRSSSRIAVTVGADDITAVDRRAQASAQSLCAGGEIFLAFQERLAKDFSVLGLSGAAMRRGSLLKHADDLRTDVSDGQSSHESCLPNKAFIACNMGLAATDWQQPTAFRVRASAARLGGAPANEEQHGSGHPISHLDVRLSLSDRPTPSKGSRIVFRFHSAAAALPLSGPMTWSRIQLASECSLVSSPHRRAIRA